MRPVISRVGTLSNGVGGLTVREQPSTNMRTGKPPSGDRIVIFSWVLGTFTGVVLSALLFLATYSLGYVSFPPVSTSSSPSAALVAGSLTPTDCPECSPTATEAGAADASETPTPTASQEIQSPTPASHDFGATATQACTTFRNRFPGTPCPVFRTPTPAP